MDDHTAVPLLLLVLLAAGFQSPVQGLDNGVGRKPALGWSSWNHFNSHINAEILKQTADAMVKNGLKDAGYEYINLVSDRSRPAFVKT
jgi:alpha-galactosidase